MRTTRPVPHLRARRGFSLLELVVAVSVMGILATIAVPAYNTFIGSAKEDAAYHIANNIAKNANARAALLATGYADLDDIAAAAAGEDIDMTSAVTAGTTVKIVNGTRIACLVVPGDAKAYAVQMSSTATDCTSL